MPWSCMKRVTFMAKRCAGDMTPYGNRKDRRRRRRRRRSAAAVAGELALRQGAERDDAIRHAGGHRRRGIADRTADAAAAATPEHVGEAQLLDAERGGETSGLAAVVAIGGEAVDVVRADAGILAGIHDRLQREFELSCRATGRACSRSVSPMPAIAVLPRRVRSVMRRLL